MEHDDEFGGPLFKRGDVLRFTMFRGHLCDPPCWAVAADDDEIVDVVDWGGANNEQIGYGPDDWDVDNRDPYEQWTIVPPDQWPGKIAALIAMRAMGIDNEEKQDG